jgi:Spy/CpxP family protein refolding chaperone
MSRLVLFLVACGLMLAAGLVVGRVTALKAGPPRPTTGPAAWFDEQLNLTPDQRKQMDNIWGETWQKRERLWERQRSIDGDREKAIKDLLTDEQKAKYDELQQQFRAKRGEFEKEFGKIRAEADEKSRALLDDTQKKRWDELKAERERMRGRHGRGPRGGPSSRPSTEPGMHPPPPPM